MRIGLFAACLLAAVTLATTTSAQAQPADTMLPTSDTLKNGQFVWYPHYERASTGGAVSIVISIPQQRAFVYQDGQLIAVSTVSTGSPGRDTPTGEFTILQKKTFHRSNLYSNAPMPYMQRLTWSGIAMHAGHLPGYPASHGCIRFPKEFARQLYDITAMGGQVSIVDEYIDDPAGSRFAEPAPPLMASGRKRGRDNIAVAAAPAPVPALIADAHTIGGDSFNVVTMGGASPNQRPASWVAGPARELVQPIPPGSR